MNRISLITAENPHDKGEIVLKALVDIAPVWRSPATVGILLPRR